MTKPSVGLFALRMKEWWEAGPPSCLLRRVGLVLTDSLILVQSIVSVVGALSLRRGRYGGPTAFPPPIHTYQGALIRPLGQTAAAPRSILKARLYRMTASFTEQMVNLYIHLGMLSRGNIPLPLVGRGKGWGATFAQTPPCLRFAQTSLPTRGRERNTRRITSEHDDFFRRLFASD